MNTTYLAMATFALVTSISPGPVNILATVSGANHGYIKSVPHILGATSGFVALLFLSGIGLSGFIQTVPGGLSILSYSGSAFLLYLSYKVAYSEISDNGFVDHLAAPTFLQGAMCQGLNPKAWIVSLSAIALFIGEGALEYSQLLAFCGLFFLVCYCSISTWAVFGTLLKRVLQNPDHHRRFNQLMGGLLATVVVYTLIISA